MKLWCALALLFGVAGSAPIALAADSDPTPAALWSGYKHRFIGADGRLVDDSQGSVSHSEGQGYAMLLAAFADDREAFDRIWNWTSANLELRADGLASWRWRPQDRPHVLDKNNATDGDLLIAWGLAEAGRRWDDAGYSAQGRKIALAIGAHATYASIFGPAISPGIAGFGREDSDDGPVVNLSYWVFPAFPALAEIAPEVDWDALRQSGLALIDAAEFGPRKLPSDWISLRYGVQPAEGRPRRFGYDVVRAPLYLAWGAPAEHARIAALADRWLGPAKSEPAVIDIDSGAATQGFDDKGYLAVAALARCAAHGETFPPELRSVAFERYYPTTLHMLALTAARLRYPQCL